MRFSELHESLCLAVKNGVVLEKNKVILSTIHRIGKLGSFQIWSERFGKTYTEIYKELDPAIIKFLELSS